MTPGWTATILGGGALIASVVGPWIQTLLANKRHERELRHQRTVADRTELRAILDDGAQLARRAMWAMDASLSSIADIPFWSGPVKRHRIVRRLKDRLAETEELVRLSSLVSAQIAGRLGRGHVICQRYDRMLDRMAALAQEVDALLLQSWSRPWELPSRRRELKTAVDSAEAEFRGARAAFVDAAHALIAAELEVRPEEG